MPTREATTPEKSAGARAPETRGAGLFFVLSCAITWIFATPAALAWMRHEAPSAGAVACAGLSALGPTLAAFAIATAATEGQPLGAVFGRWRTHPAWIAMALLAPATAHLVATGLYAALGGHPAQWLYPPAAPEQWAALVVFPLGEEFGWRGFAHPRLVARHGLVKGSLLLGTGWGLWHLMYSITPQTGGFDGFQFVLGMAELPLYSLLIAWVFERSGRSMAVAIAFHAGAHLDHIEHAPRAYLGLHALHLTVVAVVAVFAARSMAKSEERRGLWLGAAAP
jgi:membrane protease YdiL (CAAX protease family)